MCGWVRSLGLITRKKDQLYVSLLIRQVMMEALTPQARYQELNI